MSEDAMMTDFTPIPQDDLDAMQAREEAAFKDLKHLYSLASGDTGPYQHQPNRAFVQWVYDHSDLTHVEQPRLRITVQAAQAEIERLREGLREARIEKLRAGPSSFLLTNLFGEDKTMSEFNARIDALLGEGRS